MFDVNAFLQALLVLLAMGVVTWVFSIVKKDVSIVDSLWSLMFLAAALVYVFHTDAPVTRTWLMFVLVSVWALRLSAYISWRNWGEPEDARYREIRERNQPNFAVKSLYLVFGLQAVLAWVISLPLLAAAHSASPLGWLDLVGVLLFAVGWLFEAVGDWQLARFKRDPANKGEVLDTGLWRYTRHPNYFGNACLWWGLFLVALAGGGWWSVVAPLLMTFLLLRVSGVTLLEKDISERRPAYQDYVRRTSAFIPWFPRSAEGVGQGETG